MRILLIEDEAELARWLSRSLARHAGFVVEWADDGLVAERRLAIEEFDAVILDLGLPGMDGHALLAKIRARDDRTPVLVLTARDSLAEKIGTLHLGADDFLPKPFVVEELEARLIALIRRSRGREHPRLALGNLVFETSAQKFTVSGQTLQLSPREHAVLRVLIQKSGEPINKQQILDRIVSDDADINLEAIEVLVHRLRKKLADTGVQIVTMRGMGYCLENRVDN
ncbi:MULTISPECIES: response regulator [Achromobacter]|uniref:Transcriptional regulator n=1 Tax=Achromobacter spanius TaxID=217203 RepID=A0AAW3I2V7_9BURK|nr:MULTISPECIES: response regulator [Achromobacter]KNE27110.1 transcriptional regulator [Achromobacter spanius]MCD0496331.1 response regulator [Achromobacter sp. MY14]MCW3151209.1 response regulator [Achromobacter spanius]